LIIGAAGSSSSANLIKVGIGACAGTSADKIRSICFERSRVIASSSQTGLQNHLSIRAIMAASQGMIRAVNIFRLGA
jgi:hypothetical protein